VGTAAVQVLRSLATVANIGTRHFTSKLVVADFKQERMKAFQNN
jgi:hypothetical protein